MLVGTLRAMLEIRALFIPEEVLHNRRCLRVAGLASPPRLSTFGTIKQFIVTVRQFCRGLLGLSAQCNTIDGNTERELGRAVSETI